MKGTVYSVHSPDADLASYVPADPESVGVLLEFSVGSADARGADIFAVMVCTTAWLLRRVLEDGPLIGRHYVIVDRWDWPRIRDFITAAIEREDAPSWNQLGERIGRIAHWESEDYRDLNGSDGDASDAL